MSGLYTSLQDDFLDRPWTCLLTTSLPDDLDSRFNVAVVSGLILPPSLRLNGWVFVGEVSALWAMPCAHVVP